MSFGFFVANPNNITQIDESQKHMIQMHTGSVSTSNSLSTGTLITHPNYGNVLPLIMVRAPYGVGVGFAVQATNCFTYTGFKIVTSVAATVEYKLFWDRDAIGPLTANTGYGLVIYNADGEVVFASDKSVLNVDFTYYPTANGWPASLSTPTPEWGRRFIMLNSAYGRFATASPSPESYTVESPSVIIFSETSVGCGTISNTWSTILDSPTNSVGIPSSFPVIVTGYLK